MFFVIHDMIFFDIKSTSKNPLKRAVILALIRRSFKLCKNLFTVSEFSKNRIKKYLGDAKIPFITYSAISRKIIEEEKKGIKKENKDEYILFVGSIKENKGLKILLNAYLQAVKKRFF